MNTNEVEESIQALSDSDKLTEILLRLRVLDEAIKKIMESPYGNTIKAMTGL